MTKRLTLILILAVIIGSLSVIGKLQISSGQSLPGAKPTPSPSAASVVAGGISSQCQRARDRANALQAELETSLSAQVRSAAAQYAARPGPGVSTEKAWGDYAAGSSLVGEWSIAAWAGLKAAAVDWNDDTVTNAGIHLYHHGKSQDALQLLNCAYEAGSRSPYLLEALAVVNHASGNNARARIFINQAMNSAPDDVLIETEASFINTGQPPPARPPQSDPDGLDAAMRELEEHAQRLLNLAKIQTDSIDRSIPETESKAERHYQILSEYIANLMPLVREQTRSARASAPAMRQALINAALGQCASAYISITDQFLSLPGTMATLGSPLLFWSDVLRLDPPVLSREQGEFAKDRMIWTTHGAGQPIAQPAYTEFLRLNDVGRKEHNDRWYACGSNQNCKLQEDARWCLALMQGFKAWEDSSRQRHNAAARAFDRVATRRVMFAENEYLQARDYAVRQVKKMKFPPIPRGTPGPSMQELTIQGINTNIKMLYDRHLADADSSFGTIQYVREQARWFDVEKEGLETALAVTSESIKKECQPVVQQLLDRLAQEEWQAYLDHLKDRLSWSVDPQTESSFPCEGSIGPLTLEADLNAPGEGKLDLKWKGKSWQGGGSVGFGDGGITGVNAGVGRTVTSGATVRVNTNGAGLGRSVSYGPFQGKANVSFTSKKSPWSGRDYLGIKLKGSAGLGLSSRDGRMGIKCFPSSGSVTIYPRALYEDAVRYLSTPSTRPTR